jgi:hypothetical protein
MTNPHGLETGFTIEHPVCIRRKKTARARHGFTQRAAYTGTIVH